MDKLEGLPPVPLTLEGAGVLHQMFRVRWPAWRALSAAEREAIVDAAAAPLGGMEKAGSAMFSLLGHKGDVMLVHFRKDFDALIEIEHCLARLRVWDYLEPTSSYVSVVELGLYESSVRLYGSMGERKVAPHSPEWDAEIAENMQRQRAAMQPRLFPEMPPHRFICFYPMDRRRGEEKNWYQLPMTERQRQMQEHGEVGRRYAGTVKQIISGSIGFDDWEWGVDLFADDPLVFKRLIYEMRFDEVSAVYALFGSFYIGRRISRLAELLSL
ncbi:MAG TPA: hydrogen peroxide-dependent heme synthase [Bryobacteraceae bacterium]|nr:hydrogen peroxide-dependent heme synthase [Bryobacteraceae bacterium]